MKRGLAVLGLLVCLQQPAEAWLPSGWVFSDWPWTYDLSSGNWYWFNAGDVQWTYEFDQSPGWQQLGDSDLAHGWSYYNWPFAYCQGSGSWCYLNEADTQWCVNMSTRMRSRFGIPINAADTANIGGSWYEEGQPGGWGPRDDWGFSWYYIEQDGTEIGGRWEYELYQQGYSYGALRTVRGAVNNNHVTLTLYNFDGTAATWIDATVLGNIILGTKTYTNTGTTTGFCLDRLTTGIVRRPNY